MKSSQSGVEQLDATDIFYMQKALALAERGRWTCAPNPAVGCVIVNQQRIVGEGYHKRAGEPHAEVFALAQAKQQAKGATLYVTLEPCSHFGRTPPCSRQIIAAGVQRVVIATSDPNPLVSGRGINHLLEAGIQVDCGCLEDAAIAMNTGFMTRMTQGRPRITLKLAATLDGRTALENGQSQWITSVQARQDVHRHRARSNAILTGADTVIVDNPRLTARYAPFQDQLQQPWRFVLDSRYRTSTSAKIFQQPGRTICVRTGVNKTFHADDAQWYFPKNAQGKIDLHAMMQYLGQVEINDLWVECGATLAGVLIREGLVDALIVYLAPKLMGHFGAPLVKLPVIESMKEMIHLHTHRVERIGNDIKITYTLENLSCLPA